MIFVAFGPTLTALTVLEEAKKEVLRREKLEADEFEKYMAARGGVTRGGTYAKRSIISIFLPECQECTP